MFKPFKKHSEIDVSTYSYMQTVTGEQDLAKVSLDDINTFLEGLESVLALESNVFPNEQDFANMESYYSTLDALQNQNSL